MKRDPLWTVVGFYTDNLQRWCESLRATSADEAEEKALRDYNDLTVCGVFRGNHQAQDTLQYIQSN